MGSDFRQARKSTDRGQAPARRTSPPQEAGPGRGPPTPTIAAADVAHEFVRALPCCGASSTTLAPDGGESGECSCPTISQQGSTSSLPQPSRRFVVRGIYNLDETEADALAQTLKAFLNAKVGSRSRCDQDSVLLTVHRKATLRSAWGSLPRIGGSISSGSTVSRSRRSRRRAHWPCSPSAPEEAQPHLQCTASSPVRSPLFAP